MLRRTIMVLTVAAVMAAMMVAGPAGPALANATGGGEAIYDTDTDFAIAS
jgi:hypothetical protein